jgi:aminopeptidase N
MVLLACSAICSDGAEPISHFLHNLAQPDSGLRIEYYHLTVALDLERKTIHGNNRIVGYSKPNTDIFLDLASNLKVDSIRHSKYGILKYSRDHKGRINLNVENGLTDQDTVTIYYQGSPRKARKAPWDGGFVWTQDANGKPWVGVACQGIGASVWWPLRDDLHAEPDSMRISVRIPNKLMAISNGNLESVDHHSDSTTTWNWLVSYPINPYNVTINVADYVHFRDIYPGLEGNLSLDYYVLRSNESKARAHFQQVHTLMNCFESHLGPYPFYRDGFALVETPYWGMEHQSCIAYGNNYINNEWGFDFIIVHETGHEWFGNNLSVADNAELWIHESLTTYAEAIYVECTKGKEAAQAYMLGHRKRIANTEPLLGPLGVKFNDRKTSDIYFKGAWLWHTIRNTIRNDRIWWNMLKGMRDTFRLRTVNTLTLVDYVNRQTETNWNAFFDFYLNETKLPILQYKILKTNTGDILEHRWVLPNGRERFQLPIHLQIEGQNMEKTIEPSTEWKRENWTLPYSIDPIPNACKYLLIDCLKVD